MLSRCVACRRRGRSRSTGRARPKPQRTALQIGVQRLAWLGASPLTVNKSTWTLKAAAAAKADGDFWKTALTGEASSPQLKATLGSAQTLTLGTSRLQVVQFQPAGPEGAGVNCYCRPTPCGSAPAAPDLRADLHLDGSTLRADGTLQLQGTEVLRFVGRHVLARGCGEASLTTQNDLQKLGVLLQPRPPALLPLDFQAGEVEARFKMDWCTSRACGSTPKAACRCAMPR